ncbi:MAG: Type 1 glutamine amidotransferase-like domain-containing protein [Deltaproteobacteria bacterium]|nr:Type 1 glutamine amidotransferase-like domain-containing protein [Deltaproteobacteria bacterium]
MRLFLASEAKDSFGQIEKFVSAPLGRCRVAYVVTASNGEMGYGSWRGSETVQMLKNAGAKVTIIELENYKFVDPIANIKGNDIIWFAGGMAGYLLYWIRRVGLDRELPLFLGNGMIYVGSSAGSMIAGPTNHVAETFPGDEERGAAKIPGLGFIDFEILPHYEDGWLPTVKKFWKKGKLCLLKNGEAVTVVDSRVSILGEERFVNK